MKFTGERLLPIEFDKNTLEHIHRYAFSLQFTKDKVVVDLASGEGYGSFVISKNAKHVTGIDISDTAINHAKKKYRNSNLNFITGKAEEIPIPSNSVDVFISFETIEHHDKHNEMISEIKRVLKKEGVLIMSSPDKENYSIIPNYKNEFHVKELTRHDFFSLIKSNFKNVKEFYQKVNYCSLITCNEQCNFIEYSGNQNTFSMNNEMLSPIYNIAIASDDEISEKIFNSSFNGKEVLDKLLNISNISMSRYFFAKFLKLGSKVKGFIKKQKLKQ